MREFVRLRSAPGIGAAAALIAGMGLGCVRDPAAPAPTRPVIEMLWPMDGSALSDTIRARLRAEGCRPSKVRWLETGRLLIEQRTPPWSLAWLPEETEPTELHLEAVALAADGSLLGEARIGCSWSPDGEPWIDTTGIPMGAAERAAGESLRVIAQDPEDGMLPGAAITWRSDLQGLLGAGVAIPTLSLIPGRHAIRIRAEDRWRRAASVTIQVSAFSFSEGSMPRGAIEDLRWSLLTDRPDRYGSCLAPGFRFVFCAADRAAEPGIPASWDLEKETEFARRAAGRILEAAWSIAAMREVNAGDAPSVLAELREIEVVARSPDGGPETPPVRGGAARLLLERSGEPGRWRILLWNDLGAEGSLSFGMLRWRYRSL